MSDKCIECGGYDGEHYGECSGPPRPYIAPTPRDAGATGAYRVVRNFLVSRIVGPHCYKETDNFSINDMCKSLNSAYLAGQAAQKAKQLVAWEALVNDALSALNHLAPDEGPMRKLVGQRIAEIREHRDDLLAHSKLRGE